MNRALISLLAIALFSTSCVSTTPPVADYEAFYTQQPASILVLPVSNQTTSVEALPAFHSTIASPLINRGYYVFPVLPTIEIMKAEGIFEGEQLTDVTPAVFRELLGADAVLYVTIHSWDTVYLILSSSVSVSMTYTLVDTSTGQVLWKDSSTRTVTPNNNNSGSLLAMAINAAITAASVQYVDLARQANAMALQTLPAGPRSELFEKERDSYLRRESEN